MSMLDVTDCVSSPFLKSIAGLQNTELITSPSPYSKLDSFDQKQELEKEFCRDFSCCGLSLSNLHQLLEHYEEYHLSRRASNGGSGSDDDEPDQNSSMRNITCSNNSHQTFVEDDLLLQQPMHLAQLTTASSISTTTKEHFTNSDLNMLENVQKYAATASVQTLDSINDGLNTPRLSPCNSGFHNENYFDEDASENSNWRAHRENYTSTSDSTNSEDPTDKPYRCHIEDCDKAYKNANGLKYHRLHGHCPPSNGDDIMDANKPFTCTLGVCRKRYKNLNGLKYHIEHTHMTKLNLTSDMFIKPEPEEDPSKGRKRRMSSEESVLSSPESLSSSS